MTDRQDKSGRGLPRRTVLQGFAGGALIPTVFAAVFLLFAPAQQGIATTIAGVAAVFAPVYYLFGDGLAWQADDRIALALALMAGLLIWRHYENINRLLKGSESRLGQKKAH